VRTPCNQPEIVADEKGARTSGRTLGEEVHEELTASLIESTGRFVEDEQRGLARHRCREGNQLALPATQERELSLGKGQKTKARERFPGSLLDLLGRESKLPKPERDFSQGGRLHELVVRILRDVTDERSELGDRLRPCVLAGNEDPTSSGMESPDHLPGKRRLP